MFHYIIDFTIKIFEFEIKSESKIENGFQLEKNTENNTIKINFDYISKKDGVKIRILHSGNSIDDINLIGTIKDVGSPININDEKNDYKETVIAFISAFIVGFIACLLENLIVAIFFTGLIMIIVASYYHYHQFGIPKKLRDIWFI